jgi:predicted amidohydrolase YtcJ
VKGLTPAYRVARSDLRSANLNNGGKFPVFDRDKRTTRSGRLIGPDQRIGVQQALEASTIEGARQLFEEDQKGSIEVGKLADLVILDRSPLAVPTGEIKDLVVLETIKEGATIYSRGARP